MKRLSFAIVLAVALASCAHMEASGEVSYAKDAKDNYDKGEEARKSGLYQDAIKYFEHVRGQYPYATQAALADLGIADTNFDREKYVEAIEGYRSFLKLHPHHSQVDYAQFRIALSYYNDIPSDFILFPPSTEKDQTLVRDARSAFEEFLRLYPASSHAEEAKKLFADVRKRLVKHELYVADFYFRREHWRAAVNRLAKIVPELPGTGLEGEALMKLARSHIALNEKEKAREVLERLVKEFPQDGHRAEAETLLKSLV